MSRKMLCGSYPLVKATPVAISPVALRRAEVQNPLVAALFRGPAGRDGQDGKDGRDARFPSWGILFVPLAILLAALLLVLAILAFMGHGEDKEGGGAGAVAKTVPVVPDPVVPEDDDPVEAPEPGSVEFAVGSLDSTITWNIAGDEMEAFFRSPGMLETNGKPRSFINEDNRWGWIYSDLDGAELTYDCAPDFRRRSNPKVDTYECHLRD